jgi:glyoxylate reductase
MPSPTALSDKPQIVADTPLPRSIESHLAETVNVLSWSDAVSGRAQDAVGIYTYLHPTVDAEFLDSVPNVKTISNHGVGIDHINLREAQRRGIEVFTTPGTLEVSVAELAMALILCAARNIPTLVKFPSASLNGLDGSYGYGIELHGKTLGILGMGKIGMQIAHRAASFSMKTIYHNSSPRLSAELTGFSSPPRYVILEELLSSSDFLVLCAPLNEQTRGIIGREELAMMKPTASLINVARGQLVDTEGLVDALLSKTIAAAALDVTDPEPLPAQHRLLNMPNVYVTPHIGSATIEARRRMAQLSVANLLSGIESRQVTNVP